MRAWRLTTLVSGGLALVMATTQVVQGFYSLPELRLRVLPQLPPTFAFRLLWPLFLLALVFGTALSGLFARTARLKWGFVYAAVLGYGAYFLMGFALTLFVVGPLNEVIFALTFTAFDQPAATVPVAIAQLSGRVSRPLSSYLFELLGPLTGVLLWALLRRPQRFSTTPA